MHHSAQPMRSSRFASHERHRAVLDDRVALVARDHADVEETAVFRMAHRLECAFRRIAIILRSLHDAGAGVGERRRQVAQPLGAHDVVGIDHADDGGIGRRALEREIQGTRLEAVERCHVEELEARPESCAMGLDGAPDGFVARVVVDDDDFEVRVVEFSQRVECLYQHLRRLVVSRDVYRDLRQHRCGHGARTKQPLMGRYPMRLGPFVRFREQHRDDAEHADEQDRADQHARDGQVLLRKIVQRPDQHRGRCVDDDRQEAAAALAQGVTVEIEQPQQERGSQHGRGGKHVPVRHPHDRRAEFEFLVAVRVVDTPVRADLALPRAAFQGWSNASMMKYS